MQPGRLHAGGFASAAGIAGTASAVLIGIRQLLAVAVTIVGVIAGLLQAFQRFKGVGIVIRGALAERVREVVRALDLVARRREIELITTGTELAPAGEIEALVGTDGAVGVGAQLEAGAAEGAAVVAILVDQVAEVELTF